MQRRAFTLIELIIVVVVIAALIAILIPSLAQARFLAKRTACLTHTRELSRMLSVYTSDWNSLLPDYWATNDPTGATTTNVWAFPLAAYGCVDKVRQCPEAIDKRVFLTYGTATTAWDEYYLDIAPKVPQQFDAGGAYALNSWLSSHTNTKIEHQIVSSSVTVQWLRSTGQGPTFVDGIWSEVSPLPWDAAPANLQLGSTAPNDQMGRVCIARHRKTVNVAFFDSHAENVPLQQLWTLNWKPGWMPPATLPKIP